jgi:2'-5' RNA ligase
MRLRQGNPPVRWVEPDAIHLTLHFLGETDAAQVPDIATALRTGLAGAAPHQLRLARIGAFPTLHRPSVVWIGVAGALAELGRVQQAVVAALEPMGFPREERRFAPHLTLGRMRREATPEQQTRLGARLTTLPAIPPLAWPVELVTLFRSELHSGGPHYTALEVVELNG